MADANIGGARMPQLFPGESLGARSDERQISAEDAERIKEALLASPGNLAAAF